MKHRHTWNLDTMGPMQQLTFAYGGGVSCEMFTNLLFVELSFRYYHQPVSYIISYHSGFEWICLAYACMSHIVDRQDVNMKVNGNSMLDFKIVMVQ